jgi:hypothetical protein
MILRYVSLQSRRIAAARAALVALAALVGCGGGAESEVAGTVTLDGRPVGPGVVVFAPIDGTSNPADGAIQLDGSYFLKTSREMGLKAGKYKVSVQVLDQPEVKPGERSMVAAKLVTPEKYADVTTSGLEYDVVPGHNTINIDLESN